MAKQSITFSCSNCAYKSVKWLGCCPACKEWNSFLEVKTTGALLHDVVSDTHNYESIVMRSLESIVMTDQKRMISGISEWDTVVGGGIMPGSLLVLTGDPGIGKSTLLLHVAYKLANNYSVFYFSSEESLEQVKLRAERIGLLNNALLFSDQSHIERIIETGLKHKPQCIIIDSIQNCSLVESNSFPGTIAQLREVSYALMRFAKENNIAVIITCHITKEGQMAGPKTLEHMVDGVFYLQGEDRWHTRILRSVKNRFGAVHEIGFFAMTENGLEEVHHINQYLLHDHAHAPGSILTSCLEGSRPLLLEIQALVLPTKFGIPQRVITGLDHKRVILISAILEKYLQIKLSAHDIFVKISGGIKATESSADLGIALALLSSYFQQAVPEKSMALAELSLTGAIKPVNAIDIYLHEAQKFGIKRVFIASNQKTSCQIVHTMRNVYELLSLFGE